MPSLPSQPIAPLNELMAIAQVNGTLRGILSQLEALNKSVESIALSLNKHSH
jgi:hypothetical protein